MAGAYSYDPGKLSERGKDLMRFELGDTMVEGKEKTCALTDEEYTAILEMNKSWKRAKLACLEAIFRRFSYEVDTQTGPLSLQSYGRKNMRSSKHRYPRVVFLPQLSRLKGTNVKSHISIPV